MHRKEQLLKKKIMTLPLPKDVSLVYHSLFLLFTYLNPLVQCLVLYCFCWRKRSGNEG